MTPSSHGALTIVAMIGSSLVVAFRGDRKVGCRSLAFLSEIGKDGGDSKFEVFVRINHGAHLSVGFGPSGPEQVLPYHLPISVV